MAWSVTSGRDAQPQGVAAPLAEGLTASVLVGPEQGSAHLEIAVSELAPGGRIHGHIHPFEESFFILSGQVEVEIGGSHHHLPSGGFGLVPLATPHAWANRADEPARWLRARSPQPRRIGDARGTYLTEEAAPPEDARPVEPGDPSVRHVGRFSEDDLPPAGPLALPGLRAPGVRNVSAWMLVDELLGARHHTMFVVQYQPGPPGTRPGGEHFHPFEEAFFFLAGPAVGFFEEEERQLDAGDLAWVGVNTFHALGAAGDLPVRWIEVQAPVPPPSGAFFFRRDWIALQERMKPA